MAAKMTWDASFAHSLGLKENLRDFMIEPVSEPDYKYERREQT